MAESAVIQARKLIELMSSAQFEQALHLYADDIVLKDVFGLPVPREVNGIEELKKFFAPLLTEAGARMYANLEVRDLIIHETVDPDVAIAQWDYVSPSPDGEIVNPNIVVIKTRDGKITESLDYHNHVSRAKASGSLQALLDRL